MGDVYQAHETALLRSGGLAGVRDHGLIDSAVARAYSGYHRSIFRKAAALTHSLAKNHGFIDGNKRITLLALRLFIDRSGYDWVSPDVELSNEELTPADIDVLIDVVCEPMILGVVENLRSFDELVTWFRAHLRRRLKIALIRKTSRRQRYLRV